MAPLFRRFVACLCLAGLAACTHSPVREPQVAAPTYNAERTKLLRLAADQGVLFQIPESVLRDLPSKAVGDRCRSSGESQWPDRVYGVLEVFAREPRLLEKIHSIEFRRGDKAQVEISRDLDGAVTLVLLYAKTETREKINTLSDIPCAQGDMELLGKEMTVTRFEWPGAATISAFLSPLENRPKVERLDFDRRFLGWLADRLTIFRLSSEIAFEKAPTGKPLLVTALGHLGEEITAAPVQPALEFWLKEITAKSRLGTDVKFFGLRRDARMSTGLQVDSAGKFARKMNGFADPTYPFISYKFENGAYSVGSLSELATCLNGLMSTYRSPLASMSNYDLDPDSFLFPGHSCN